MERNDMNIDNAMGNQQAARPGRPGPTSMVDELLHEEAAAARSNTTKANTRLQLARLQNKIEKKTNNVRKCKQRVKAALEVMREHEAALDAARNDERRLKRLLIEEKMITHYKGRKE